MNEKNMVANEKNMVDKDSDFYKISMKSWLQDNVIWIHLLHNEEKIVLAEKFIRTLKNKIYNYLTSISKKYVYW